MKLTIFSAVLGSVLLTGAATWAAQPVSPAKPAAPTTYSDTTNSANAAPASASNAAVTQANGNYNSNRNWHSSGQSWLPASEMPHVQHQGNVTFVSGGVGMGNRAAMNRMAPDYNLRLLFAVQRSGDYLANVGVRLVNAQGQDVLNTKSHGPFFFAQVAPGHYKISVSSHGQTKTQRINISAHGVAARSFYWPSVHNS